jgi:hypothetical protein
MRGATCCCTNPLNRPRPSTDGPLRGPAQDEGSIDIIGAGERSLMVSSRRRRRPSNHEAPGSRTSIQLDHDASSCTRDPCESRHQRSKLRRFETFRKTAFVGGDARLYFAQNALARGSEIKLLSPAI